MNRLARSLLFAVTGAICVPAVLSSQQVAFLRGTVRTPAGIAVVGANVFVIETLEGALTDSGGRFDFAITARRPLTVLVKRLGFSELRHEVGAGDPEVLSLVLTPASMSLAAITVQAGAYTAGEERGATLTALEVVTTPGTAADVNRAIQLLPGVQAVDDGTALFVRGGDYTETRVFMNEASLLNPAQFLTPSGTFVGTVDPFQLDGIFFSSGGFGARYGNALSGVVGLRTRGAATRPAASVSAGLAALSIDGAARPTRALTLRVAGNRTDLDPFFKVNGNPRGFSPSPSGHDASASATFTYGLGGEVKAFLLDQSNLVGVPVDDPGFAGTFNSDVRSRLAVVRWKDVAGAVSLLGSLSRGTLQRREDFGAFRLAADQDQRQGFVQASWEMQPGSVLRAGGEVERVQSSLGGSLPRAAGDRSPGSRTSLFALDAPGSRIGAFVEADLQPGSRLKVVPGVRVDRSTLTSALTVDPRVSAAWRWREGIVATAAWGVYHQVPDPLFYSDSIGRSGLPSMRATQMVLGLLVGDEGPVTARVEGYAKRYRDLALQDRDYRVTDGAEGTSRGVDVFFKGTLPWGMSARTILSHLVARRTDPGSGVLVRAPFDVTWSRALVVEKAFSNGARAGLTYRASTGRPFTPVISAQRDPDRDVFLPTWGAANSERFPGIQRLDLAFSRYQPMTPTVRLVTFVSLSNVLNADNTQAWAYSHDYSQRSPVRSIFNRSAYFGATLLWQ